MEGHIGCCVFSDILATVAPIWHEILHDGTYWSHTDLLSLWGWWPEIRNFGL